MSTSISESLLPATETRSLRMSYEEYLAWDHEGGLAEWVDGEVMIYMSATKSHQRVVDFLNRLLGLFARLFHLGTVHSAPYAMRAVPGGSAREPDLLFVAAEHQGRLTDHVLHGPADLVIEVISDDSVVRDRQVKFQEYQAAGVREYWLIDPRPNQQQADFYVLDAHGQYQPVPSTAEGVYHAMVLPDFWLRLEWLWQEDPDALGALAEVVGAERVIAALRASATNEQA